MRALCALSALVLCACGAVQTVPADASASDGGTPPSDAATSDASRADGAGGGGGGGGAAKVCVTDQDCNEDPAMSSLAGTCFSGACICRANMFVQPSGKCGTKAPAECAASGGTCRQQPATCAAGELEGADTTNRSCGDLVAAVCCVPAASCKAPVDLVCCGASTTPHEPICVNGWKTCGAGAPTPALRQNGCF